MKSENKNFLLNVSYQFSSYLFPLITIPYISRILGVENIGTYSYTYSIVNLFMLAAMLGMNNYGNREIAKARDNQEILNRQFSSMYGLQVITCGVAIIAYFIYVAHFVQRFRQIALLQSLFLISTLVDINWFYFGLEKFKLTITRNILFKSISLVLIFLLVKTKYDLSFYTVIMGGGTLISQLYLFVILHRYVKFVHIGFNDVISHFKQVTILFIPVLAYGIYAIMDKTMIGAISSITELGYYENAHRINSIPISIITALGTVMLPRMSYIIEKDEEEYKLVIKSSMKLALILTTTMTFGIWAVADEISVLMFGQEFTKSAGILRFLSLHLVFTAWANVVRTQFLIPKRKDSVYVESTIFGAMINLILNLLFIPNYGAYGACIGTVLAEIGIMLWQTVKSRMYLDIKSYINYFMDSIWRSALMFIICMITPIPFNSLMIRFIIKIVLLLILFVLLNYNFIRYDFLGKGRQSNKIFL